MTEGSEGLAQPRSLLYKRVVPYVAIILSAGALLVFPFIFTLPFPQHLMITIFVYVAMSQSWNLLGGYTGQVSLGHAVYFGIAAYASVLLQLKLGMQAWPAFFLGILSAIPLSLIIGIPTFRLAGHYFAIATVAVGEVMRILFQNWEWAGAAVGLHLPICEEGLLSFQFHSSKAGYYYVAMIMAVTSTACVYLIQQSRWGYYFRAIKGDQAAASALGVNPAKYKLIANMVSACIAGSAGAFYAQYVLFIDPFSVMASKISVLVMLLTVLGGAGTLWGPIIGTFILIPISEFSRIYWAGGGQALDQVIYGALIVFFAVFQPAGLLGLLAQVRNWRGRGNGTTRSS
jgi:branched-chain amino acid transport system permease protein